MLTVMFEAVYPCLGVGLSAFDRCKVVRLSVVIPSEELDEVELVTVCNHRVPAGDVKMIIRVVNPLGIIQKTVLGGKNLTLTFLL